MTWNKGLITGTRCYAMWGLVRKSRKAIASAAGIGREVTKVSRVGYLEEKLDMKEEPTG